MNQERTIGLDCVIAVALWAGTFMLIAAGTVVSLVAHDGAGMAIMAHGLALSAAAATVTIRNGLRHQNKLLEDAFRLGQDAGANVRRVR